jgi:hypothetical protein
MLGVIAFELIEQDHRERVLFTLNRIIKHRASVIAYDYPVAFVLGIVFYLAHNV